MQPVWASVILSIAAAVPSASAQQPTVLYEHFGTSLGDYFGCAVAGGGDVDADGVPDYAVGGTRVGGDTTGEVRIYSGASGSLIRTIRGATGDRLGAAVDFVGDLDSDGHAEIIAATTGSTVGGDYVAVYSGLDGSVMFRIPGNQSSSTLGHPDHVAGVGDVDADGVPDFAIGENDFDLYRGRVRVFSGQSGTVIRTWAGYQAWDSFGHAVAGAGDVDLDGHADVIVGAPAPFGRVLEDAYVEVFSGRTGASLYGQLRGGVEFGHDVCGVGDVDGDGHPDFAAGAARGIIDYNDPALPVWSFVRVFSGANGSVLQHIRAPWPNRPFGQSVGGGGDYDGDGVPDVVIGAGGSASDLRGRFWIFSGSDFSVLADVTGTGDELLGTDVNFVGDVHGDGRAEVVVGAEGRNALSYGIARVYGIPIPSDTTPPSVVIASPSDDDVIGTTSASVEAYVTDAGSVTVSSTPAGLTASLPAGGGPVSGTLPLSSEGGNTLTVTAIDDAGNVGGNSVTVVRDTIPPIAEVVSPLPGAAVGSSPVTFQIHVQDATATMVHFGANEKIVPRGGGTTSGPVDLVPGTNQVTVNATDEAGHLGQAQRTVVLDLDAPEVVISAPAPNSCYGAGASPIRVDAVVTDLTSTTVVSDPAGIATTVPPGGGPVFGEFALAEGLNTIEIGATDATGKSGQASLTVTLDTTPPTASFVAPHDGAAADGTIDVKVEASDPVPGCGVDHVDLEVDGVHVERLLSEPFETVLDTTVLPDGAHTLRAVVKDRTGNQDVAAITILVDNTVLVVTSADLVPRALSVASRGHAAIRARLEGPSVPDLLPLEFYVIELLIPGGSPVRIASTQAAIYDSDGDGIPELDLEFDRQEVLASARAGLDAGLLDTQVPTEFRLRATTVATGRVHDLGAVTVRLVGRP